MNQPTVTKDSPRSVAARGPASIGESVPRDRRPLAPTVYCPPATVEQCVEDLRASRLAP